MYVKVIFFLLVSVVGGFIVFEWGKVQGREKSYLYTISMPLVPSLISALLILLVSAPDHNTDGKAESANQPVSVVVDRQNFTFSEENGKSVYSYSFTPLNTGTHVISVDNLSNSDILSSAVYDSEGTALNFVSWRVDDEYIIEVDGLVADETYLIQFILN